MDDKKLLEKLGNRIKDIRTAQNLTQYELADRSEVNRNYIGMLERGERNATYLTLLKIAQGLNTTLSDLLKD